MNLRDSWHAYGTIKQIDPTALMIELRKSVVSSGFQEYAEARFAAYFQHKKYLLQEYGTVINGDIALWNIKWKECDQRLVSLRPVLSCWFFFILSLSLSSPSYFKYMLPKKSLWDFLLNLCTESFSHYVAHRCHASIFQERKKANCMYKENPARVYFDQDHVLTDFLEKQTNEGKYEKKIQKEKENTIKEEEKYIPLFLRNWLPNNLPVFQRVICFFF